jgi:hypothetical protein
MSDIVQWVIVGVIVVAAAIYLVKHLRPSKKDGCCAGCPYAGSCSSASEDPAECEENRR